MRKTATNENKGAEIELDKALVAKAVSALLKHHKEKVAKNEQDGQSLSLLGNDVPVQVQFGLELSPNHSRKVIRIDIPNSFHQTASENGDEALEDPDVCLIVKDESKPWIKEMVEEHSEHMGCVKKVLSLDSLRKKHSSFQQRRELLKKYDVFMADERILPMLTSALGKDFVKANKLPLPIAITRKAALPFAIQRNLSATYMTLSQGTSVMVRAGTTGMKEKKLVENILAIARYVPTRIPRGLSNIRNVAVKTPESTSLPFYHKLPEELAEIAKLAGLPPAFKPMDDAVEKKDEDKKDSNKRKTDAVKSPLVRALKKQKQGGKDTETKKDTADDSENKNKKGKGTEIKEKTNESAKKRKKQKEEKSPGNDKSESKGKTDSMQKEKQEKGGTPAKSPKAGKEKAKKESVSEKKVDFVASKKFKGSKEGYVFRAGKEGVGYYIDKKPVVDKMMLQALMRSSESGSKRGRSSSAKKRKGRR